MIICLDYDLGLQTELESTSGTITVNTSVHFLLTLFGTMVLVLLSPPLSFALVRYIFTAVQSASDEIFWNKHLHRYDIVFTLQQELSCTV